MTSKQQCTHVSAWVTERMPCPWCQKTEIEQLRIALRKLIPEGWDDPEGHMDHMPGIRTARLLLAGLPVETNGNPWAEYTNAIGDAGHQYMQRCDGRISSGFFYWHELWDALNLAASQGSSVEPFGKHPGAGDEA